MNGTKEPTSDRILRATLRLMQDKGFKSVTVQDIAQASGVSEMTVFRRFGTKKGVLEAAIQKHSFVPGFRKIFEERLVYDFEKDLHLIAASYLDLMEQNLPIFLIAVQERTTMPDLAVTISSNTKQLKMLMAEYFKSMQQKNKMVDSDIHAQSVAFMAMLFGYFSSIALWDDVFIGERKEEFIRALVETFRKGVQK